MTTETILLGLAGVLAAAAPVIFATIGETFSERSGVINLSVNGTILLSAMTGFALVMTNPPLAGTSNIRWVNPLRITMRLMSMTIFAFR